MARFDIQTAQTNIQATRYDIRTVESNVRAAIQIIGGDIIHAIGEVQSRTSARLDEVFPSPRTPFTRCLLHRRLRSNLKLYCALSHRLHCLDGCACRCHRNLSKQVIPHPLAQYTGSLVVSNWLLRKFGLSRLGYDLQTCQQCIMLPSDITWYLPGWLAFFDIEKIRLRGH